MRLFVALNFPDDVKDSLVQSIDRLRGDSVRGNFTRRENLHLTLAFLGELPGTERVVKAMNRVRAQSFPLALSGYGKFKRDGGDIYWVGVENNPSLNALYDGLWTELAKEGFQPEQRAFRPHLTLGREVVVKSGFQLKEFAESLPLLRMDVEKISLMKSERIGGRLTYTEVYSRPLDEEADSK